MTARQTATSARTEDSPPYLVHAQPAARPDDDAIIGHAMQILWGRMASSEAGAFALHHNAAAVILAHNHPSGVPEPSRADELLTQTLKSALAMVDVRVLDHIIVGRGCVSLAERGLL